MEELIRSRIHEALEVVQPDPGLRSRVMGVATSNNVTAHRLHAPRLDWALGAIALLLAVAIMATLLYARNQRESVLGEPTGHAVPRASSGMVTPTIGWSIGRGARLFRTTDAGLRWINVTPAGYSSNLIDTYFLDGNHAWLTESATSSSSTTVLRTSDGGASWQRGRPISVAGTKRTGSASMFFIDRTHGWLLITGIVADGTEGPESELLYRTSDGGSQWQRVSDGGRGANACHWISIAFSSLTTGWITASCPTGPAVLMSPDGGLTWKAQFLPAAVSGLYPNPPSPAFFDESHGILVAGDVAASMTLFVTSNGGQTWTLRPLPGEVQVAVSFADPDHGWAIGGPRDLLGNRSSAAGVLLPLYRTSDGGQTWTAVRTNLLLESPQGRVQGPLNFVDQQDGFAVAFNNTTTQPATLLLTTDGGATWRMAGQIPS